MSILPGPTTTELSTSTTSTPTTSSVIATTTVSPNKETVMDIVNTPDTSQIEGTSQVAEKVKDIIDEFVSKTGDNPRRPSDSSNNEIFDQIKPIETMSKPGSTVSQNSFFKVQFREID